MSVLHSITGKRWVLQNKQNGEAPFLARQLKLNPLITNILVARGIVEVEDVYQFLKPKLSQLPDPLHLKDMDKALKRLKIAVKNKQKIAIFGDYDVDGSCAAALFLRYFRALGLDPLLYIPDRLTEGYGPNAAAMHTLKKKGAQLIITVDTGSMAYEAMEEADKIGLDVIITDHHQTTSALPISLACVNPNRFDEISDCNMLCGAGVAFYVAMGLNRSLREEKWFTDKTPEPNLLNLLDLVAMASVADMVPLEGINRVLVHAGLKILKKWHNKGLKALATHAGVNTKASTYELGFQLGPRINAGGRIDACNLGAKLLSTEDETEAEDIALRLHRLNEERKKIEKDVLESALKQAEDAMVQNPHVLVLADKGWHAGVIGIVASRIKEIYYRPTFIIAVDDDGMAKGSGRSVEGVNLGQAVHACADVILNGGGHEMAAGISLKSDQVNLFREALQKNIYTQLADHAVQTLTPRLCIDAVIHPQAVQVKLVEEMNKLEPYGPANHEPVFMLPNVTVSYAKTVGTNASHVKCTFKGLDGKQVSGIAFYAMENALGDILMSYNGQQIHVAGTLKLNSFQGRTKIDLQVKDIWLGDFEELGRL